jgi:hypothetical protein
LIPCHGAPSGCGWGKRQSPFIDGSCLDMLKKQSAAVLLSDWGLCGGTTIFIVKEKLHDTKCYTKPPTWRTLINVVKNLRIP